MAGILAIGCFVFVATALAATLYERRLDVLYGGYVTPSFRQRWIAVARMGEA